MANTLSSEELTAQQQDVVKYLQDKLKRLLDENFKLQAANSILTEENEQLRKENEGLRMDQILGEREPKAPEWLPIEQAPKDGTLIDVWIKSVEYPEHPGTREYYVCWEYAAWRPHRGLGVNLEYMGFAVTHFMLSPEDPK